jgi:Flp pilus assembly pilin Flp
MTIKTLIHRFKADEDGAVTVDWVVLTAGLVVLVGLIGGLVATGVQTAGQNIQNELTAPSTFKPGATGGTDGG